MRIKGGHEVGKRSFFVSKSVLALSLFTVGTASLLSLLTFSITNSVLYPSIPTDALGNSGSAEIGLNVKEFIKLAVDTNNLALKDEDNNTIITPTTSGTLISGDVNLAVTTNTEKGYSLSVYTADNTKAMSHSNSGIEASIAPVDTAPGYNATNGISSLANNTWGFRKLIDTNTNTGEKTYSNWYSIGSNSTNGTIIDSTDSDDSLYCDNLAYPLENTGCSASSYNTYEVNFGAKLTNSLPAGTYANNVVFSAVAKSEGIKYRLIFNPNPTGANGNNGTNSSNTITGSMSPKTILAGSTTTLPKGTFEKEGKGIKGWALVDNATLSTTPIYDINSTVQVDTILADAETAGQTPDTNNNEINLYTVWDTAYTLEFQYGAEDVEGTPFAGTTIKSNNLTFPEYTAFSKEGYTQIGWALVENATAETTPLFEENQTISISNLITAAQNAGQSVSPDTAGKIVLYAVWEKNKIYMQDWFGCANLSVGETVTLVDKRDNTEYTVKKFGTGSSAECWMTSNLKLGYDKGYTLTNELTNIPSNDSTTYYLPPAGYRGSVTSSSTLTSANAATFDSSTAVSEAHVQYAAASQTGSTNPQPTGYYNYPAASLGYSGYGTGASSGNIPRDICPKGWQLPRGSSTSTYSFYWLDVIVFGGTGSNHYNSDERNKFLNQASFGYTGYYSSSALSGVGSFGRWWSSTLYNDGNAYNLFLDSNNGSVYPQDQSGEFRGLAVRCVDQNSNVSGYMQDFDSSTLAEGESTALIDKRDGSVYTVKKIGSGADAEVWMTSNLKLGYDKGYTLTNELTNIPSNDSTTYYLPPAGYRGDVTSSSTPTSTDAATFDSSTAIGQAHVQYRAAGTTDNNDGNPVPEDTGYYNYPAASLGYSGYGTGASSGNTPRDICPKGWQLPRGGDTATYSFYWLDVALGGTGANRTDTTTRDKFLNQASFGYTGYYNSGTLNRVGSYGYWQSSTVDDSNYAYFLRLGSNGGVYPQNDGNKYCGFSVRCVVK